MQRGVKVPPEIVGLTSKCSNVSHDQASVVLELFSITDDFCDFRADELMATDGDNDTIILRGIAITDRLEEWYAKLPQEYIPVKIQTESATPEVLSDYYYAFNDLYVSSMHSLFRVCSLLAYEILLLHLCPPLRHFETAWPTTSSPLSPSQSALLQSTAATMLRIIDAVCANAPYHLGFPTQPQGSNTDPNSNSTSNPNIPTDTSPAVRGNPILWPLYMAGKMPVCPPATRTWIIGRLHKLGNEIGIAQGLLFARFLSEGIFVQAKWMDELLAGKAERHVEL
ncbi:MAG: hypothetical protein Q9160_001684 [Pyrenula sp. 1 TL-2023]